MSHTIDITNAEHVYLLCEPVDMRKGIDGMASAVRSRTGMDPSKSGLLFIFINKSRNKLRLLYRCNDSLVMSCFHPVHSRRRYHWLQDNAGLEYVEIKASILLEILKSA